MHECPYYPPTSDTANAPWNCAKDKKGEHVFRFHFPGQIQLSPELIPFPYISAICSFPFLQKPSSRSSQFCATTQPLFLRAMKIKYLQRDAPFRTTFDSRHGGSSGLYYHPAGIKTRIEGSLRLLGWLFLIVKRVKSLQTISRHPAETKLCKL